MSKPVSSTQENVPIAGVKDGVVILRDGQYRMIFEVSAVNFSLKSEEEQNSLVLQYQSFLNSIHFPIEITIRSKKLDLAPYINRIKKLNEKQTNELLKMQTTDYIDFVGQLINLANIMKKTFYVAIGYQPLTVGQGTVLDKLFNRKKTAVASLKISDEEFNHNAKELRSRGQSVAQGLGGIGLHCKQLNTEEVVELFYGIYNPEVAGKERLTEAENISSDYVTTSKPKAENTSVSDVKPISNTAEETPAIDNRDIVVAKEKQKTQEKAFENQSTAQRSVGMTSASEATPKPTEEQHSVITSQQPQAKQSISGSPTTRLGQTEPRSERKSGMTEPLDSSAESTLSKANVPQNDTDAQSSQAQQTVPPAAAPTPNQTKTVQEQVTDPDLNKDYGW